jgi:hypothetical protein
MSVVVYELNEVPRRLFDFYADAFPNSAFAQLRIHSNLFETLTADVGGLSPWITWPTMHRGVSNVDHEISELGQTLSKVNAEFPNVYNILAQSGVKVGVFGSLQSYPLPKNLDNYCFYVPDTFAAGDECFPDQLTDFQSFNLSMVRANGRNVSNGIAVKSATNFLKNSIKLGLKPKTFLKLSNQMLTERVNKDRLVRRRTSQVEIAFDIYFQQLKNTQPDISFFFTNHVASSMHRYWPTVFPKDYEDGKFERGWLKQWAGEIPHAVKVANFQLQKIINHCHASTSELIVCSSMGQGAVEDVEPIDSQVLITNVKKLMSYIGLSSEDWEPKLSMAPRIVLTPLSEACTPALERLKRIKINGYSIGIHYTTSGDIRLDISLTDQSSLEILDGNKIIAPNEIGIENVKLQDASGSYAYHIPEGIMMHYNPVKLNQKSRKETWNSISALDFAPSLLLKFGVQLPSYMKNENIFSSSKNA